MKELCEHHISGQLKVAPEHISDNVLTLMGKPENSVYERFKVKYNKMNETVGKSQFVVPYLISSHPGSTLKEAVELAEYLRDLGYMPEQVQDFYPTPSTISTCMYYTGLDPKTMKEIYVPKSPHEKAMQRALIQYRNPKNYDLVVEALKKADRADLIGFHKMCLIRPRQFAKEKQWIAKEGKDITNSNKSSSNKSNNNKSNSNKSNSNIGGSNKVTGNKITNSKFASNKATSNRDESYKTVSNKTVSNKTESNKFTSNKTTSYKGGNTEKQLSTRNSKGKSQDPFHASKGSNGKATDSRTNTKRNHNSNDQRGKARKK